MPAADRVRGPKPQTAEPAHRALRSLSVGFSRWHPCVSRTSSPGRLYQLGPHAVAAPRNLGLPWYDSSSLKRRVASALQKLYTRLPYREQFLATVSPSNAEHAAGSLLLAAASQCKTRICATQAHGSAEEAGLCHYKRAKLWSQLASAGQTLSILHPESKRLKNQA